MPDSAFSVPPDRSGRVDYVARRISQVEQAQRDAHAAADLAAADVGAARARARAARERLADEIRRAAASIYGAVNVFEGVVSDLKGVSVSTVHNALYTTFSADTLARCAEVLVDHRLDGQSRRAA